MTPNDDLARWGEPPASEQEMRAARELAERLDQARDRGITGPPGDELLEVDSWLPLMVTTVLTYSGLAQHAPCPADPGGHVQPGVPRRPDEGDAPAGPDGAARGERRADAAGGARARLRRVEPGAALARAADRAGIARPRHARREACARGA